jgi:hypothetical protein
MRSAGTVARRGLHMAFLLQHLDILINFHQTWNFNPSPFLYIERTTSVPCLLLRDPEPAYFVLAPVRLLLTPPSPSLPPLPASPLPRRHEDRLWDSPPTSREACSGAEINLDSPHPRCRVPIHPPLHAARRRTRSRTRARPAFRPFLHRLCAVVSCSTDPARNPDPAPAAPPAPARIWRRRHPHPRSHTPRHRRCRCLHCSTKRKASTTDWLSASSGMPSPACRKRKVSEIFGALILRDSLFAWLQHMQAWTSTPRSERCEIMGGMYHDLIACVHLLCSD